MKTKGDLLDTETQGMLEWPPRGKLAPPTAACFAVVLLEKGADLARVARAIARGREPDGTEAGAVAGSPTPVTVSFGLTHSGALLLQYELVCADCVSVFVEEHVVRAPENYLRHLYARLRRSPEFAVRDVEIVSVPRSQAGAGFLDQFLGVTPGEFQAQRPMRISVMFKKARIMKHWADRIGADVTISEEST